MRLDAPRRRLCWHGLLLVLLGLVGGAFISAMANPRMGLSAHVGTLLNGVLLLALGAAWDAVALGERAERATFWLLVDGSYAISAGLLLAAVLGTRDSTPIHGAAVSAAPWAETLVLVVLSVSALAVLVGTAVALAGLGGRSSPPSR